MSGTLVLYYHSISENVNRRIDPSIVVQPAYFERQLAYLAKHAHVVPLSDLIDSVRQKRALPRNNVVLTFDDGYKDNLTTVVPLLQKYGFPATFFLATGYIGTGRIMWEHRLSYILHNTSLARLTLDHEDLPGGRVSLRLEYPWERTRAFNWLANRLGTLKIPSREVVLEQIETLAQVPVEQVMQDLMLTWDDVRTMATVPGITFGCHTVEHERLSALPDDEIRRQILDSRRKIEENVGVSVCCFSYPYGLRSDFDERAIQVLKDNGFDGAVTTSYTSNGPHTEVFSLGRILAANSAGLQFGLGLALRSSPIGEMIRRAMTILKHLT